MNKEVDKLMGKINNDPVLMFDWIMCISFGLIALVAVVVAFLSVYNRQFVFGCAFGLSLMSLCYSPLVEKKGLLRILLSIMTLFVVIY